MRAEYIGVRGEADGWYAVYDKDKRRMSRGPFMASWLAELAGRRAVKRMNRGTT